MSDAEYTFWSDTGLVVTALRDESPPYISGGYGGWTVTDRMRRVGLPQYEGVQPVRLVLPILFDGWIERTAIEKDIGTLERMARPVRPGDDPPIVHCRGARPRQDISRWLIEDLDFSSQSKVIWDKTSGGVLVRYRQDLIVKLVQKIDDDLVKMSAGTEVGFGAGGASTANRRPSPVHHFHIFKKGETLAMISGEEYGSPRWVRDIMKANGIRDPKAIKINTRLRLP